MLRGLSNAIALASVEMSANGTIQGTAALISARSTYVVPTDINNRAARLPVGKAGDWRVVANLDPTFTVLLFPATGEEIYFAGPRGVNASANVAVQKSLALYCPVDALWMAVQLG
jgi:hypothetical protein